MGRKIISISMPNQDWDSFSARYPKEAKAYSKTVQEMHRKLFPLFNCIEEQKIHSLCIKINDLTNKIKLLEEEREDCVFNLKMYEDKLKAKKEDS